MSKEKVAFIEDDTADGGLGFVFRTLAKHFSEKYSVVYISTRGNEGRLPETIEYIQFHEIGEFVPHTNGPKRSLAGVIPLRNILKKLKPDAVISFGFYSNIRTSLASIGLSHKVLISERGNAARFKGGSRFALQALLARTDKIVFQSHAAMNAYPPLLGKKGTVINNAIFKDDLPNASETTWDNRIVSVGRIHPDKNFPVLVEAFSLIADEFPEMILSIYGEEEPGSERPYLLELKKQVADLNLETRVAFMGQTNDVGHAIAGARLFVLSSVLEGMPNALIEAMACGLPCVSTDFLPGCAHEIITDGVDGLIAPNEDASALANKMKYLLNSDCESRRIARNATKIRMRLSKDVIFRMWEEAVMDM